jgi:uncharacterized protein (TIGR03067 family)
MKQMVLLSAMCLILSCNSMKTNDTGMEWLNGTWMPVEQELGGKELPAAVFEMQRLMILDSTYMVTAESIDKGVLKFKDNKMDIYGRDGVNAGKHFTAIYKYENELLTICYNLAGDSYPVDFVTQNEPTHFMSVFKKKN